MAASGGFSFGAAPSTNITGTGILGGSATGGGFSFGSQGTGKTATPGTSVGTSGGFSFGSSTTQPAATGIKFGATTSSGTTASTGGFKLGGQASTPLNLGSTTKTVGQVTPTLKLGGLGTAAATTTSAALGGGGFSFGAKTTASGLTLGATTNTLSGSTGLTLGGAIGTSTGTGGLGTGGLSLGAKKPLGVGTAVGLGTTTAGVSTSSKGLGGVDPASLKTTTAGATNGTSSASNSKAVKETSLPNEIGITVNEFKDYVKKQKAIREEISRFSSKPMHKVKEEMLALRQLLSVVSNSLQRNTMAICKLKMDSANELKNVDMAHRTHDIPRALQMDHTAPAEYFQRLIQSFEEQMQSCNQEIELIESHLMSLSRPSSYTPQDLSTVMIKMNETFIALAANLQTVHEAVKTQKEQYLNYRRVYHGDTQDVFAARRKHAEKRGKIPVVPSGPGPFDNISNATAIAMAAAMQSAQKPTGLPTGGLAFGFGTGNSTGATGSGFGTGGGLFGTQNTGLGTGGLGTGGIRPLGTQTTGGFGSGFGTGAKTGFGSTGSSFGTGFGTNTGFAKPTGTTFGSSTGTSFGTSGLNLGTGLSSSNKPTNLSLGGSLSAGPTSTGFTGFGSSAGKKRGF